MNSEGYSLKMCKSSNRECVARGQILFVLMQSELYNWLLLRALEGKI